MSAVLVMSGCGDFGRGGDKPAPEAGAASDATSSTQANGGVQGSGFDAVQSILQANCAGCHGSGSATAFRLTGNAEQDYGVISGLVDTANPDQSRLLLKGSAQTNHGGGAVLDTGGAAYQTILTWVTQGAGR